MGTYNRPENGRGAWVALCTHPTHSDTDVSEFILAKFITLLIDMSTPAF
jgi:hypothetical protein